MIYLKEKFDVSKASVTGNTEEEESVAEKTTDDAVENSEASEIIDKDKDKFVTIEEYKKTLEYQETMNLDIENISSLNQQLWMSIYEVIDDSNFKVVKLFPTEFLYQCKNSKNEPQNIPNEVRADFKKGFEKWVVCTIGYAPSKGVR